MARETRVWKPVPLKFNGSVLAYCNDDPDGNRAVVINHSIILTAFGVARLTAWLARAQAWVEDAKKGGG